MTHVQDFGACSPAHSLAVYASRLRLPWPRKTRFRLTARLGRAGISTRGNHSDWFPSFHYVMASSNPRLRLAHNVPLPVPLPPAKQHGQLR